MENCSMLKIFWFFLFKNASMKWFGSWVKAATQAFICGMNMSVWHWNMWRRKTKRALFTERTAGLKHKTQTIKESSDGREEGGALIFKAKLQYFNKRSSLRNQKHRRCAISTLFPPHSIRNGVKIERERKREGKEQKGVECVDALGWIFWFCAALAVTTMTQEKNGINLIIKMLRVGTLHSERSNTEQHENE